MPHLCPDDKGGLISESFFNFKKKRQNHCYSTFYLRLQSRGTVISLIFWRIGANLKYLLRLNHLKRLDLRRQNQMLEQSMQTKRPSSHCHKGHKTDQPGGCNSQIQKQNKGKFLCHLINLTFR